MRFKLHTENFIHPRLHFPEVGHYTSDSSTDSHAAITRLNDLTVVSSIASTFDYSRKILNTGRRAIHIGIVCISITFSNKLTDKIESVHAPTTTMSNCMVKSSGWATV